MVVRSVAGHCRGDDVEDLRVWLRQLGAAAPPVSETVVLTCQAHGDDAPTWAYVEADPTEGVARRRCLACALAVSMLDSAQRWTHPPMWACARCGHSIAELAAGLSLPDGTNVEWVVLAARCVECGSLQGLADMLVDRLPLPSVLAAL